MMHTLTKSEALRIQAEHLDWYTPRAGVQLRRYVEERTNADALPDDGDIDILLVNRHIPRGGAIEVLQPHVVTIGDKLYGYGETRFAALTAFEYQIAGADVGWRASMRDCSQISSINCDHASEVAEMLDATVIEWS